MRQLQREETACDKTPKQKRAWDRGVNGKKNIMVAAEFEDDYTGHSAENTQESGYTGVLHVMELFGFHLQSKEKLP